MKYKGFEIRIVPYRPMPFCSETVSTAIFHGEELQAYVSNDDAFARHVIDVKLKEGAWPKKLDCRTSRQSATKCSKLRQSAAECSAV